MEGRPLGQLRCPPWRSVFLSSLRSAQGKLARPKRFELLTPRFVVWCSIQLSYGRVPGRRAQNLLLLSRKGKRGCGIAHDLTPLPPKEGCFGCLHTRQVLKMIV